MTPTRRSTRGASRPSWSALRPSFRSATAKALPTGTDTRYGKEGIKQLFDSYMEAFDALRLEPEEFIDAGDQIVVSLHQRVRGKGSGAEVVGHIAHVWTMRGGSALRLRIFGDKDSALEALRAEGTLPARIGCELSSTTAELAIGSEFAGYRIEEVAARGGMGVVYRAVQLRLTRTVALKLVTPALARDASFRERFRREWMIAASIDHPNVIPVYEAGEEDGALFIAMRWVEGTDLRELIDRRRARACPCRPASSPRSRAPSMPPTSEDLIHRDVKPANILITGQDHVYLTDFGLTKHASSISGLTRTGQWVGTVDYTAPEQIEGAPVTPRTDVYSLGCVLFEALTGRPPVQAGERPGHALGARVCAAAVGARARAGHTAGFRRRRAAGDGQGPAERYASAGELGRAALAAAARGGGSGSREKAARLLDAGDPARLASRRESPPRWPADRRLLVGLAGLLLLVAAVAGGRAAPRIGRPEDRPRRRRASSTPLRAGSTWRRLPADAHRPPEHGRVRCSTGRSGWWAASEPVPRARGRSRATTR